MKCDFCNQEFSGGGAGNDKGGAARARSGSTSNAEEN